MLRRRRRLARRIGYALEVPIICLLALEIKDSGSVPSVVIGRIEKRTEIQCLSADARQHPVHSVNRYRRHDDSRRAVVEFDLSNSATLRVSSQLLNLCDSPRANPYEPYQVDLLHVAQIEQNFKKHGICLFNDFPCLRIRFGCLMREAISHNIQPSNLTKHIHGKECGDLQANAYLTRPTQDTLN